ncbi:diadenylate cyclase CdaA [Persephonella sp. KM09-Lau-8]|uniref:diadenylate cyclase CdaA n=1 Tax=Persephonella sp. KM09-Lau-8 TaxID=1158345 RepID=UPI000494EB00|nr:diadenylate cyclase CdaA [Persephonella sp. KM09-Lau-8]
MFDSLQWLIGLIKSIRINDIIDILIVATIIYYLLKFIIGTRGWQILIGLFILLSIWLVAKILHLPTIEWIFDNLWSIGIFILIVVFQPEIRRGLAKLGERGLFRYSLLSKKKAIDEIIRAATFLAERKIGALIVFERNIDLENYTEGCVKLNAEISLELLISIFIPQTPLHDGAVIIRDQEVLSARCFLPLTINPNIPQNIGTRHRAGIGISEETDAVALIVSEERGEISLAIDGKLFRDLDPLTLRKKLIEVLEIEKPDLVGKLKNKLSGKKKWKK